MLFIERKMKIDDPVGSIAVHGVCGAWGVIALGLFADGTYGDGWNGVSGTVTGLFYGAGWGQLIAEIVGLLACTVYLGIAGCIVFKVTDILCGGIRVSPEVEMEGLDIPEMGVQGYSGIHLDKDVETPHSH